MKPPKYNLNDTVEIPPLQWPGCEPFATGVYRKVEGLRFSLLRWCWLYDVGDHFVKGKKTDAWINEKKLKRGFTIRHLVWKGYEVWINEKKKIHEN